MAHPCHAAAIGVDAVSTGGSEFRPPFWYDHGRKHHPVYEVDWRDVVRGMREGRKSPARYHPSMTTEVIRHLEMGMIETNEDGVTVGATEIEPRPNPNVRLFWREFNDTVGASNGEETRFVLVEYSQSGSVHGRPITWTELQRKGARR